MKPFPEENKPLSALLITGILSLVAVALIYLFALLASTGGYSSPLRALITENALGEDVYLLAPLAQTLLSVGVLALGLYFTAAALMTHAAHLALERERLSTHD